MGLFDNFQQKTEKIDIEEAEAPVFLAYILYADDGFNGNEVNVFLGTVQKFVSNPDKFDSDVYFPHFQSQYELHSEDDLIKHCTNNVKKENKLSLFCFLVEGVLADAELTIMEKELLIKIQHAFGIKDQIAKQIIDVMILKNKQTEF